MTVAVGDRIPPFEVAEVSAEKMKTIAALLGDPNPIHWDLDAVAALGMGDRPINQGPLNMGYVINMLAAWAGGRDRVRRFRVRFRGNVLGGDHLIASGVVIDVRTEDGVRLAECEVSLDVVDGAQVLSGTATVQLPEEAS
ncbi:MaoC family dehydratase [Granulicoccus phenolivorans]|uniref:MaoC family dehydratase n=1 Tax=Granulicoccus phenolivorans TaxID=266854 RepID=UPI00047E7473|nr:MaoC/PaaZ C-terminal domain-containing protein [Granulicoccus phenolivorans]